MLLKKIALIGTLGVFALPAIASATLMLHTLNNTPLDSTVSVPATGKCSNSLGDKGITKKNGGTLDTPQLAVRGICGVHGDCIANLYATDDCGNSGPSIGSIKLNVDTVTIEEPATMTDTHYTVSYTNHAGGGTDVTIDYKP